MEENAAFLPVPGILGAGKESAIPARQTLKFTPGK
jgi:hypothetical protein